MSRRLISTAVGVREAPSAAKRAMAALRGQTLALKTPTEAEMRTAVARLTRDLEDMRVKRGTDFEPIEWPDSESPDFIRIGPGRAIVAVGLDGDITIRGYLVIERVD